MSFSVDSVTVAGKSRNGVRLKLTGTESWDEGEYRNERNASKEVCDDLGEMLK